MNSNNSMEDEEMMGGQEVNENSMNMEGGRRRRRSHRSRKMKGGRKHRNNNNDNNNGNGNQDGGAKIPAVGTKAQVWHGTAKHTSGGLTKSHLMKTKKGRIVSKKKHALGKKSLKNLRKAGYVAKKGTFKLFRKK